jgi:hypothetical protein
VVPEAKGVAMAVVAAAEVVVVVKGSCHSERAMEDMRQYGGRHSSIGHPLVHNRPLEYSRRSQKTCSLRGERADFLAGKWYRP